MYSSPWAAPMSRTPRRSGGPPPVRPRWEEDMAEPETPRRVALMRWEREDLPGFTTPSRMTVMGRERFLLEFRTPQHPSMGSNNWGGASPLLARNIPTQSLDTKYLRLNTVRTRDEIFPMAELDHLHQAAALPGKPGRGGPGGLGGWFSSKLKWKGRKAEVVMGARHKKRSLWLPVLDYRSRWPQGW